MTYRRNAVMKIHVKERALLVSDDEVSSADEYDDDAALDEYSGNEENECVPSADSPIAESVPESPQSNEYGLSALNEPESYLPESPKRSFMFCTAWSMVRNWPQK